MYQILLDDKLIYDPRLEHEGLIVINPKCNLEVNTCCSASFGVSVYHPYYDDFKKLKSVIEIRQDNKTIFRGRIIADETDLFNTKTIDVEGAMAYFNDSVVRPFTYPEGHSVTGNTVEFFLNWLINNHNSQVQDFQKFRLGTVTVSDPNNYITRSDTAYKSTWTILKEKLFESSLGGYLCIRYEEDGNYIDYLSEFTETNSQKIVVSENLLDITKSHDATETFTAVIPLGATTDNDTLTIKSLPDGAITDDLVKQGDTVYSVSGVNQYGWIYAPTTLTKWDDVTVATNLQQKAVNYFENSLKITDSIEIKAVDLSFSADETETLRIYRNINVESHIHNINSIYPLTKLSIDIENPANTLISISSSQRSLIADTTDTTAKFTVINNEITETKSDVSSLQTKFNIVTTNQTYTTIADKVIETEGTTGSFTLPSGVYYIEVVCQFEADSTGKRSLSLNSTGFTDVRNAVDGDITTLRVSGVIEGNRTIDINVNQNSGNSLTVSTAYCYHRIA